MSVETHVTMRGIPQVSAAVVGLLVVAGCASGTRTIPLSSTPTSPSAPTSSTTAGQPSTALGGASVTVDLANYQGTTITLRVGEPLRLDFDNPAGKNSGWTNPASTNDAVITLSEQGHCATPGPCYVLFTAKGLGPATITIEGPSGMVCGADGTSCVAVAAILQHIAIDVSA